MLSLVVPCTLSLNLYHHPRPLLFLLFNEPASVTFRFKIARKARTAGSAGWQSGSPRGSGSADQSSVKRRIHHHEAPPPVLLHARTPVFGQ